LYPRKFFSPASPAVLTWASWVAIYTLYNSSASILLALAIFFIDSATPSALVVSAPAVD